MSGYLIPGQVLGPDGRPAAQARVYFVDGPVPLPDIAMLTGDDGAFRLAVPVSGVYRIGISAEGCKLLAVKAVVEGKDSPPLLLKLAPADK